MAKPSTNKWSSELGTEEAVDSESTTLYNKSESVVRLRSLRSATVKYTGLVTGKQYEWEKAGSVVEVDSLDSETLLAKRTKSSCCGNPNGTPIFELVI